MWTSSVTAFTALMFVVHFNLITRMKYITWVHIVSICLCSILPYLIYMWLSNWISPDISNTQFAVSEAHASPMFYLRIACCIGATFFRDYAVECWNVCITQNPADFLLSIIKSKKSIEDPVNLDRFNQLVEIEDNKAR